MDENEKFQHGGSEYEIRVARSSDAIKVRVFKNNKPANRYTYTIQYDTASDLSYEGHAAIELLMNAAKSDIVSGLR